MIKEIYENLFKPVSDDEYSERRKEIKASITALVKKYRSSMTPPQFTATVDAIETFEAAGDMIVDLAWVSQCREIALKSRKYDWFWVKKSGAFQDGSDLVIGADALITHFEVTRSYRAND